MANNLPTHFFISRGVLEETKKWKEKKETTLSNIAFYLLLVKHRLKGRDVKVTISAKRGVISFLLK